MFLEPELSATNPLRWIILLCVSLLASACGDKPAEKTVSSQCTGVETVPAAARRPVSNPVYKQPVPEPATSSNQVYRMPAQNFPAEPVQQGWGMQSRRVPATEPAWGATQQTFREPQNTDTSPWAMSEQSAVQPFQRVQRPWGPSATPAHSNRPRAGKDTTRPQPDYEPWKGPVGGGYYGWGPGPYGVMPGGGYPGYPGYAW